MKNKRVKSKAKCNNKKKNTEVSKALSEDTRTTAKMKTEITRTLHTIHACCIIHPK